MTSKDTDTSKKDLIVSLGSINCSRFCEDCIIIGYTWFRWRAVIVEEAKTTATIKAPPLELCNTCFAHVTELIFQNAVNIDDDDDTDNNNTSGDTTTSATPPPPYTRSSDSNSREQQRPYRTTTINGTSSSNTSQHEQQRSPSLPRCPKRQPSSTLCSTSEPLNQRIRYPAAHPSRLQTTSNKHRDRSRSPRRSPASDNPHRHQLLTDHGRSYTFTAEEIRKQAYIYTQHRAEGPTRR